MSNVTNDVLEQISAIFVAADEALNVWTEDGSLPFPTLLGSIATKMNWDDKQTREADPIIRYYIRRNPEFVLARGAKGGVQRAAKSKTVKTKVKEMIETKLFSSKDTSPMLKSLDPDNPENLIEDMFPAP